MYSLKKERERKKQPTFHGLSEPADKVQATRTNEALQAVDALWGDVLQQPTKTQHRVIHIPNRQTPVLTLKENRNYPVWPNNLHMHFAQIIVIISIVWLHLHCSVIMFVCSSAGALSPVNKRGLYQGWKQTSMHLHLFRTKVMKEQNSSKSIKSVVKCMENATRWLVSSDLRCWGD